MIGNNIEHINENKQLSKEAIIKLIPNLPLDELILTEYEEDSKWKQLIQLKDSSQKLFQCCLCNIAHLGPKILYSHLSGKKHNLKIKSVKQLYHPKYHSKKVNRSPSNLQNSNTTEPDFAKSSYLVSHPIRYPAEKNDGNEKFKLEEIKISKDIDISGLPSTTGKTIKTKKIGFLKNMDGTKYNENTSMQLKEMDDLSAAVVIENTKNGVHGIEGRKTLRTEDLFSNCNRDEPPLKKTKLVLNPAAISKQKIEEVSKKKNSNNENTKCLSNLTITPTKNKKSCNILIQPEAPVNQIFSNKTFSHNPVANDVLGLIGVEYILKILNTSNRGEPRYECSLCEFVNNALGMQDHLLGYNHRLKFCEKHFPTALRQYKQYIRNIKPSEIFKVMTPILNRLAVAIEYHHGRELPFECLENEYNTSRHEIFSKVFSCRHASEQYGPTFTHIVNSKEVDKFIKEIHEYKSPNFPNSITFDLRVNTTSHDSICNIKTTQQQGPHSSHTKSSNGTEDHWCHQPFHRYDKITPISRAKHNISSHDGYLRSTCILLNSPCDFSTDQKLISSLLPTSSLHRNDIWQTYIQIVDKQIMELSKTFQIYRTDPESHPAYNEEWQAFWRRRKNELIEGGLDHRTYNYQPEWVRYFNSRIEELYNQAVKDIKSNARDMLRLPMTNKQLSDEIYNVKMGDVKMNTNFRTDKYPITKQHFEIYDYDKQNQTVSLIRLLASFGKYLGSLGPKVNQLLTEVLEAERNYPCQLNSKILTEQNCSILETAMEKFKGLISADIIDCADKRSLTAVIGGLETLLYHNNNMPPHSHPRTNRTHDINIFPEPFLLTNETKNLEHQSNLLQIDKRELSLKLANMLAVQGKTDIDPTQLQRILSVYMMIEKKKKLIELLHNN